MDSLELLSVASAVNEALHLHESGVEDLLLARRTFGEWMDVAAEGLATFDAQMTFRTSGSTGCAKACAHLLESLEQEVSHLATLTVGAQRLLSAVPAHHIYGFLFTILLPARFGTIDVIDVRRFTPQALVQRLRRRDLVVGHPAYWTLMARYAGALPAGVHGVTSTAPCPNVVAQGLQSIGLSSLLQVYGSSETAGIATRTSHETPYQLMPFWARDEAVEGRLLRTLPNGTVCAHPMQDALTWSAARLFGVSGRLDDAVQVAGTNVFPSLVRQEITNHPLVADAVVRLMAPEEGARLKTFVVPVAGADLASLREELWSWCESRLTAPARPRSFTFGDGLPRNAMGKLSDWSLTVQGEV